jgi:hypothetical protein
MIKKDLERRVARLIAGERRIEDLHHLYLALRENRGTGDSVREIGDFVAHRAERSKGPVTQIVRDVFTSADVWLGSLMGKPRSWADFRPAIEANMRLASNELIKARIGLRREVARSVAIQAMKKIEKLQPLTKREERVLVYFGGSFIWKPAFTDETVFEELKAALVTADLINKADQHRLAPVRPFLALYVITLMHGSSIVLEQNRKAELRAGFDNEQGCLEVKAILHLQQVLEAPKKVTMPLCVFWTGLKPESHCCGRLAQTKGLWEHLVEIADDGRLTQVD